MSQSCRICSSSSADAVNADLTRGLSVRDVAARFGFSRSGTDRHARRCLPRALAACQVPQQTLADQLTGLWAEAKRLQAQAEADGDTRAALVALRQLVDLVELEMRAMPPTLRGPQKQVQITVCYEKPKVRPALSDTQLVEELGHLARRTKSEQIMATAARLAVLLSGRPISQELDEQLAKAEAGPPQLPEGDQ